MQKDTRSRRDADMDRWFRDREIRALSHLASTGRLYPELDDETRAEFRRELREGGAE